MARYLSEHRKTVNLVDPLIHLWRLRGVIIFSVLLSFPIGAMRLSLEESPISIRLHVVNGPLSISLNDILDTDIQFPPLLVLKDVMTSHKFSEYVFETGLHYKLFNSEWDKENLVFRETQPKIKTQIRRVLKKILTNEDFKYEPPSGNRIFQWIQENINFQILNKNLLVISPSDPNNLELVIELLKLTNDFQSTVQIEALQKKLDKSEGLLNKMKKNATKQVVHEINWLKFQELLISAEDIKSFDIIEIIKERTPKRENLILYYFLHFIFFVFTSSIVLNLLHLRRNYRWKTRN